MPNDTSSLLFPFGESQTVSTNIRTDIAGRYEVRLPIYDIYGRLSRYETKMMYPEEYQRAYKKDQKVHII